MKTTIGTSIEKAVELLTKGAVVSIPTETVYGLGGHGFSEETVAKIFSVKNRPSFDPLILHTSSLSKIDNLVANIPPALQQLADSLMPGPLTILVEKTDRVPDITTSGLSRVAIRIPNHPMVSQLLEELPFPLAAPSANPFGYVSPTTALHVAAQLDGKIPYILDGGPCTHGLESTIVEWTGEQVRILRKGSIPVEDIASLAGPVLINHASTSSPAAPGMLKSHYATRIPLRLISVTEALENYPVERIGQLAWKSSSSSLLSEHTRILSTTGDFTEAARNLFSYMRELDKLDLDIILAELLPEKLLGRAINDKLRRASA